MRERGIASASRRVRLELGGRSPRIDRPADCCVSLRVRRVDPFLPVRVEVGVRRQVRACCCGVARRNLDVELRGVVAELGEPEPLLVHEIESEAVRGRAGSDRGASSSRSMRSPGAALTSKRSPSQRIGLPRSSSQWYERLRPRQGAVPAFSSWTRARVSVPACGGSSS